MEINYAIRWIEIYPVDSANQRLNNWGQECKGWDVALGVRNT